MILKVLRTYGDDGSRYIDYDIDTYPGMTVLDALFEVRERSDDSLAFRYSCRGAVCGSCAMMIDKVPRLACRTQIEKIKEKEVVTMTGTPGTIDMKRRIRDIEVLIEPLPNMPVIRDLIVDMDMFFEKYRYLRPVLLNMALGDKESPMGEPSVRELERYTNCILCAACYAACPVIATDGEYLGPASLAKLYRFHIDPREKGEGQRIGMADSEHGWWACRFFTNCQRVCPRNVTPNIAIGRARQESAKRDRVDEGEQDE